MPDDSNGIYNVPPGTLVNTGDTVLPSQHNPWAIDSSQAISNRFSKDGRSPATGDWDINNFRLKQVGNPTASGDGANKNYVDTQIAAVTQNAEKISTQSGNYTALLADKATSFRFTASATLSLTAAATLGSNWWCEVWATNGNVTIDPNGAETINGSATLIIQTGQSAKVFCTGTQFFAWVVSDSLNGPQLQGYYFGLGLSTNATDTANDIDIAVGSAAADTSPYALMQLNTALTKRIDANWAAGNNQGGLDTGSVSASATYYIWLIQRSDTLVTDALFSLSSTAPTMPSNYDRKRLIGYLIRASSINGPTSSSSPLNSDVKAWVNFNGTGVVSARASKNISSITDNGVGDYTVNFLTPLEDGNYAVGLAATPTNGRQPFLYNGSFNSDQATMTTSGFRIAYGAISTGSLIDCAYITAIVTR